jgi:predicted metal-binding protein
MSAKSSPVVARPRRPTPVLVCRKCLKRAEAGREIKRALKSELKQRAQLTGGKRPRVVMTSCFGICPKHAVVLASDATLQRGEYALLFDSEGVAAAADILKPESAR